MKKALVITLISFLVLSSVSAWPFSQKSTSVVPLSEKLLPSSSSTETSSSIEETKESALPSTDSQTISIPKAEFEAILKELEAGTEDMEDGHAIVSDAAVEYEKKYNALMKPRYIVKAIGEWNSSSIKAGFGVGALFSQKYYVELGVMKNDLSAWNKEALTSINGYTISFGLGYTF